LSLLIGRGGESLACLSEKAAGMQHTQTNEQKQIKTHMNAHVNTTNPIFQPLTNLSRQINQGVEMTALIEKDTPN
jgi:hypothetical protein